MAKLKAPAAHDPSIVRRGKTLGRRLAFKRDVAALSEAFIPAAAPIPITAQPPLLDSIMSPEEMAKALGVSVATLLRWHHRQQGPPRIKIPGSRKIYYHTSDADEYLRALKPQRRAQ